MIWLTLELFNADLKENVLINHLPDADGWTDDYRAQIKSGSQFHDTDPIGFRLRERDVVFDYRCDFLGLPMGPCESEGDDVEPPTDEETEFDESYAEFKRNSVLIGTRQPVDIEEEELFSKDLNEEYDDIYGWFNFSQYNNPAPTVNDQFSYVEGKNQDILWQTMFDLTPLDGNLLYDLRSIKTQLKRKRLAYSLLTTLKQHWNYYRYSMCCSEIPSEQEAFAVLVGIETPGVYNNSDQGEVPISGGPVPYTDQLSGEEGPADNSYTHDTLYWPIYRYAFYPVEIVPKWDPTLNYRATIATGSDSDPSGKDFLGRPCDAYHGDGEPKRVYERYDPATLAIVSGSPQPNNTNNLYQLNHDHLEWFNINPNKNANYYAIPKGIQFELERDEETGEIKATLPYHPSFTLPDAANDYGTVSTDPNNQDFGGNRCKIKEGVVKGFFERGTNVAWNLNELSNFWTWTNPGINMYGEDYPNHPENFSMMPVGAVFGQDPTTASPDPEINDPKEVLSPPDETYRDESTKSSELLGRIVRLTPILKSEYELPLPFNDLPINCADEDGNEEEGNRQGREGDDEDNGDIPSIFPDSIKNEEGVSRDNGIFMIVNKIFGTKNLPKPFGGRKEDLQVFVREEDPNDPDKTVLVSKDYEQDCRLPISTQESTGAVETPIYIFDVENAHDGNCEGAVAFGPYMSNYQLEEEEEEEGNGGDSDGGDDDSGGNAGFPQWYLENELDIKAAPRHGHTLLEDDNGDWTWNSPFNVIEPDNINKEWNGSRYYGWMENHKYCATSLWFKRYLPATRFTQDTHDDEGADEIWRPAIKKGGVNIYSDLDDVNNWQAPLSNKQDKEKLFGGFGYYGSELCWYADKVLRDIDICRDAEVWFIDNGKAMGRRSPNSLRFKIIFLTITTYTTNMQAFLMLGNGIK